MTIQQLITTNPTEHCTIAAQITKLDRRETKDNKPFIDVSFNDGTAELKLKAWNDSPAYARLVDCLVGDFVKVLGHFRKGDFGWDSRDFAIEATLLTEDITALLEGSPERRALLDERWLALVTLVQSMKDTALLKVTTILLTKYEEQFRRAAAARTHHHARRGGLVEHVTEMAFLADGVCHALPQLNRSLLIAAVIFHDAGKIRENQYEPRGFAMPFDKAATLCGHIAIGFQLAKDLWAECELPPNDDRLLLLRHLILSHHGQKDFGSPVEPMCPEAAVLHYIDQISAKTEMFKAMYLQPEIAPGLHESTYPLHINAVTVPPEQP